MNHSAVLLAIGSAVLFGLSAPVAKLLLKTSDPWMLAGILYSGAGVGLLIVHLSTRGVRALAEAQLTRRELPWLAAAILSGGVIGPVLLLAGLVRVNASAASLLLTLEGVLTALLAWFVFKENFDRRIARANFTRLTEEIAHLIISYCDLNAIDCVYRRRRSKAGRQA